MLSIQKISADEGPEAVSLIVSVSAQFIFADYTEEGIETFRRYVTAAYLATADAENFTLVAKQEKEIVGVAKVRSRNHLSMLFVASPCQRRGYGRSLLEAAVAECKIRSPDVTCMTASGSKFGLPFFLKHGFQVEGEEKNVNGIRFTPIRLGFAIPLPKKGT